MCQCLAGFACLAGTGARPSKGRRENMHESIYVRVRPRSAPQSNFGRNVRLFGQSHPSRGAEASTGPGAARASRFRRLFLPLFQILTPAAKHKSRSLRKGRALILGFFA